MSRARNPFRPGVVLAVLAVGAVAFLLFLYSIGQGWTGGPGDRNGGEHAASNSLNGFGGLATLLEATGDTVEVSRSEGNYDSYGLLILTPPHFADAEAVGDIIESRADFGPTMLVLPKWYAMPVPENPQVEAEEGWVRLVGSTAPGWFGEMDWTEDAELEQGTTQAWSGYGRTGVLAKPEETQALGKANNLRIRPVVVDSQNDMLAGLATIESGFDYDPYPVLVVFEPDLLNNLGMANEERAKLALQLVDTATEGEAMDIYFDLTLSGLGASDNLLTLAFRPPFLAATLCLLFAALVIAWRAFSRFGPTVAEAPAMAQGKRQLARNGAALVARTKRFHLLKTPYEALVGRRVAERLGVRSADMDERESAIDRVLERRGHDGPGFARLARNLRAAEKPRDIIRAASALREFERNVTQ